MKLRNVTLATAILLALTGCGSSGGGGGSSTPNSEVNNQQNTQAQVEQQKAEMEALKKQLTEAQNNQKQQQDKLQADLEAQKNALAKAQENLTASQSKLAKAEADLKTAQENEQKGNADKTILQNQLNQANENLRLAQTEKANAEKALADRIAEENKLLTREEVFNLALNSGFNRTDANDLADDLQNNKKSVVTKEFIETHKTIALKRIARAYGLSNNEVNQFARENRNNTLEEAAKVLERQTEEIAKKREILLNDLFTIAKEKGLDDWEANNFVYGRNHTDKEDAVKDLNNYLNEKAERETKINELMQLAKEKGLEEWDAQSFANQNLEYDNTTVLSNLNNFLKERENTKILEAKRLTRAFNNGVPPDGLTLKYEEKSTPYYNVQGEKSGESYEFLDIYNQKYSIVVGRRDLQAPGIDYYWSDVDSNYLRGLQPDTLPVEGNATYNGVAFHNGEKGNLVYNVNFSEKEGKGKITGLDKFGHLTLEKGKLVNIYGTLGMGVASTAIAENWKNDNVSGEYWLFFYGPNAEEIAGNVKLIQERENLSSHNKQLDASVTPLSKLSIDEGGPTNEVQIGFGGTRGEIQK